MLHQLVAKTIKRKEKAKESSRKKWDKRIKDQVTHHRHRFPSWHHHQRKAAQILRPTLPRAHWFLSDEAGAGQGVQESRKHLEEKQQVNAVVLAVVTIVLIENIACVRSIACVADALQHG